MRMKTICKHIANADLLMLFACRTACLHVWMMWHAGWLLTGCSSITPSPKFSGAHQHAVSTRSHVVPFVSEAQPFDFDAHNNIYGTAKARVAKFCMQVEYIKC